MIGDGVVRGAALDQLKLSTLLQKVPVHERARRDDVRLLLVEADLDQTHRRCFVQVALDRVRDGANLVGFLDHVIGHDRRDVRQHGESLVLRQMFQDECTEGDQPPPSTLDHAQVGDQGRVEVEVLRWAEELFGGGKGSRIHGCSSS